MTRDLKARLKEHAENFKYDSENVRVRARELYKVARDAIALADALQKELNTVRQVKLPELLRTPHGPAEKPPRYPPMKPLNYPPPADRATRIKTFLAEGLNSDTARRFFKWSGMTFAEASKYLERDPDDG